MTDSNWDDLLSGLLRDMGKCLTGAADYWALAQSIWDAASDMTSHEERHFREYLQWLEGNLDMLLNLGADDQTLGRFLQDQMVLIEASRNDVSAIEHAERQGALNYFSST